nr:sedoheptulose-1,7-bisphosphatase, chloroplastic-like [Tanacetum cinerariifolium]
METLDNGMNTNNIKLTVQEYEALRTKGDEAGKASDTKVATAISQVKTIKKKERHHYKTRKKHGRNKEFIWFFLVTLSFQWTYTLRYTGRMVLDVNQIIVKEKVEFSNAISPSTKGKLSLHFEVAPLRLWIKNVGGYNSDETCLQPCDGHDLFE